MKRYYFKMKLKPGCEDEYKKRHAEIWPELKGLLRSAGIEDYSISFDKKTNILYASQKLPDDFEGERLSNNPVMRKWWKYMADIMETNMDSSPVCIELEEMFYLK